MDCAKLQQDITRLTAQKERLIAQLDQVNETMRGKAELKALETEARELEDAILEEYLGDFAEKNPEVFGWQLESKAVFERGRGAETNVRAIAQLPNGNMLVGGDYGVLCEYRPDEEGHWELGPSIAGFEEDAKYWDEIGISAIAQLPNGNMLVGGWRGALYEYGLDKNGRWKLGPKIAGFESSISAIAQLPNGNMLIGGDSGALCEYGPDENGEWKLGPRIAGFNGENENGMKPDVYAISQLPSGNMLVGGRFGTLYEYGPNENGEWKLGPRITGFEHNEHNEFEKDILAIARLPNGNMLVGGDNSILYKYEPDESGEWKLGSEITGFQGDWFRADIRTITQLPNGNMLIGGDDGLLYEYGPDKDGNWKLGSRITGFKDAYGEDVVVTAIAQLPDGNMLVGGYAGALYEAKKPPLTVDTLRQNLDKLS